MNDNILRIKNLKKTYHDIKGEIPAIEDINIPTFAVDTFTNI